MWQDRIKKFLIWIVLYLSFLEIFLWLGGRVFLTVQDLQNRKGVQGSNIYKIMCLGDSLTAEGEGSAYPIQLEKYLNQKSDGPLKFKVINHGIPGADSTIILSKTSQWIHQEHPDMVVVMMGYNDRHALQAHGFWEAVGRQLCRLR